MNLEFASMNIAFTLTFSNSELIIESDFLFFCRIFSGLSSGGLFEDCKDPVMDSTHLDGC